MEVWHVAVIGSLQARTHHVVIFSACMTLLEIKQQMNSVMVQRETCQQIHSYTEATVIARILFIGADNVGRQTVLYLYAANNRRREALCLCCPSGRPAVAR